MTDTMEPTPARAQEQWTPTLVWVGLLAVAALVWYLVARETPEQEAHRLESDLASAKLGVLACQQGTMNCADAYAAEAVAERNMNRFLHR